MSLYSVFLNSVLFSLEAYLHSHLFTFPHTVQLYIRLSLSPHPPFHAILHIRHLFTTLPLPFCSCLSPRLLFYISDPAQRSPLSGVPHTTSPTPLLPFLIKWNSIIPGRTEAGNVCSLSLPIRVYISRLCAVNGPRLHKERFKRDLLGCPVRVLTC